MNFSAELNNQKLSISAVDKRSTAIVTPLPALKSSKSRNNMELNSWENQGETNENP